MLLLLFLLIAVEVNGARTFMAKRRALLLLGAPSKRCHLSPSGVDRPLESMAPSGGATPRSLLDLMGTRCRKRPRHQEEDPETREEGAPLRREPADCDTRKRHAANLLTLRTSGSSLRRRSFSAPSSSEKRPRGDCAGSEAVTPKANDEVSYRQRSGRFTPCSPVERK